MKSKLERWVEEIYYPWIYLDYWVSDEGKDFQRKDVLLDDYIDKENEKYTCSCIHTRISVSKRTVGI